MAQFLLRSSSRTQRSKISFKFKNTLQNGSFAVIQEDDTSMPFTPYTLLVVCDGQLLRIPIIKHQTVPIVRNWFSQRGTFLPKDSYSLSSSLGDKMVKTKYLEAKLSKVTLAINKSDSFENSIPNMWEKYRNSNAC